MKRAIIFAYGLIAYAAFFVSILWAMGFVGNYFGLRSIDSGQPAPSVVAAILVNSLLLGAFAISHTVMARKGFKSWIVNYIPPAAERSTFVLVASLLLLLTFWQWQAMPATVWKVDHPIAAGLLQISYWFGWFMVFFSSFLINHFDLFGLRQVTFALRGQEYQPVRFRTTILYKFVRHPLLLGFLIAFWSAPVMSEGRLLFALLTTAYIFVGIQFEERDLATEHGEVYRRYQRSVPMLIPHKGIVYEAALAPRRPHTV